MITEIKMQIEHADRYAYSSLVSHIWHSNYTKWDDEYGGFLQTSYLLR